MKAGFIIATLGVIATLASSVQADAQSPVRDFPYPFSHLITIASDPNQQTPKRGVAIHRLINEDLGLPISDAMWVKTDNPRLSGLFTSDRSLNRSPSGVGQLPNFAILLREWHRGNIDMINGWQDETSTPLRSTFDPPLTLGHTPLTIKFDKTLSIGRSGTSRHLRLFFDGAPPTDLSLVAIDAGGHKANADYAALQSGRDVQLKVPKSKVTIAEVVLDQAVPTQIFGVRVDGGFDLAQLSELTLTAPSCEKAGCDVAVLGVERDDFSRATVMAELPWLEAWNIRPAVYTSNSISPAVRSISDDTRRVAAMLAPVGGKMSSRQGGSALISEPYRQNYIIDLLGQLGVQFLSTDSASREGAQDGSPSIGPFNGFSRTRLMAGPAEDKAAFGDFVRNLDPSFDARFIDNIYCHQCGVTDGAMLALPLDVEMKRVKAGKRVDAVLATQFSTGDDDWRPTTSQPLKRSVVVALKSLANLYYGFDGRVPMSQRVWVPPASAAARYRQLMASIRGHLVVDGNTVTIAPWRDDATGQMIPDLASGTRDLNGLTVYVPDPRAARVLIGGTEIKSFTVNAVDETGKPSITIIDDNNPTTILGRMPLRRLGMVTTQNAVFDDVAWPRVDAPQVTGTATLKVGGGDGWITVHPRDLTLDNTTWIRLRYRHAGKASRGTLFVELTMGDGGRVVLSEGTGAMPPDSAGSGWWMPRVPGGLGIVTRILPTYGLLWAPSIKTKGSASRPPLPIGRVKAIRIGLLGATKDETVELLELSALRSSGNAVASDGKLVLGGQVTDDGEPKSGISVAAVVGSGGVTRTVTDDNGLYFFPHLAKSEPVYILASSDDGKACAPMRTAVADMQRNVVDLDIDFARCEKPADVATTYLANTR